MSLVSALWRRAPGMWGCLCTKLKGKDFTNHFFKRPFGDVDKFIRGNQDKDIYFCPHLLDERARRKEHAILPRMLWADLDEIDPRKCDVKPTVAIESSPGRYVGLWYLNAEMSEELNKRLTYYLGADHGGWDLTQVLRVPGTTNYKYTSMPRVRELWVDGPTWKISELEGILPKLNGRAARDASKSQTLYKKYESELPRDVRQIMNSSPTRRSDRSEVLWKLERSLLEAGATRGEAFTILRNSPWNKFSGRRDGDEQLRRELDKGVDKKLEGMNDPNGYRFLQRSLADVEERDIKWLWYPCLARGEVTILEGDPGIGKSYIAEMISKAFCDGERLPWDKHRPVRVAPVQGKVAYFDVENTAATVTKKRLRYNECEHPENFYQEEEPFNIDNEEAVNAMYEAIEQLKPVLIVFDTINLYIGKADISRANEATQALSIFKEMARRFNCAVMLLRHLTKGNSNVVKALYRGQGNIAFAGVARIIMTAGHHRDQDEDENTIAVSKLNLAKRPRALTYSLQATPSLRDPDRVKFVWGEYVDYTSDEILSTKSDGGSKMDNAEDIVRSKLEDGPVELSKLREIMSQHSISDRTLQRVLNKINARRKVTGKGSDRIVTIF